MQQLQRCLFWREGEEQRLFVTGIYMSRSGLLPACTPSCLTLLFTTVRNQCLLMGIREVQMQHTWKKQLTATENPVQRDMLETWLEKNLRVCLIEMNSRNKTGKKWCPVHFPQEAMCLASWKLPQLFPRSYAIPTQNKTSSTNYFN